jgi:SRSO17 transposase
MPHLRKEGIVEIEVLASLRPELDRFAREFDDCFRTHCSRAHLRRYMQGQLSDLPRKSVEPIALETGVPPRTLQEFLSIHRWDEDAMRDRVQEIVVSRHAHDQAIGVIDETSFAKKGDKTPGVQRQHCGATGKTDNCVVTVHLGYVAERFHALLDGDLYLPESWHRDRRRCRQAGIPDDLVYRPKWQIALEVLRGAVSRGVQMRWLCADEAYGRVADFRLDVADLGLWYVVEIPCNTTGWLPSRLGEEEARRVDQLWERGGPAWEEWRVKDTEKGPAIWQVRAVRFCPQEENVAGEEQWLVIARNVIDGEVKYFLSNAPKETPLGVLLYVAFSRWHIERIFEECKTETGMDHYEGRLYRGLRRHLFITSVSLLFLAEQKERLSPKKGGPDSPSNRSDARSKRSWGIECRRVSAAGA